jgi:hypothetical protein
MHALQRVTFQFDADMRVHYLPDLPRPGDLVTHGRELWTVTRVEADAVGAVVVCEPPPPAERLGLESVS